MDSARIIFRCVIAAVIYGVVHSEIAIRVCLAYFTVYLPPIFGSTSPTWIGLAWGVIATWWAGGMIGVLVALAARSGPRKLTAQRVLPLIHILFVVMAACAIVAGVVGYKNGILPRDYLDVLPANMQHRFMADMYAHTASFLSAIAGTIGLCAVILATRIFGRARPMR